MDSISSRDNSHNIRHSSNCHRSTAPSHVTEKYQGSFSAIGTYPYNKDLFTDADFAAAEVVDRPNPDVTALGESEPRDSDGHRNGAAEDNAACQEPFPGTSAGGTDTLQSPCVGVPYVSPSAIHPFPKAQPRKTTGRRKKRATKILTATPVRDAVAAERVKKDRPNKATKKEYTSICLARERLQSRPYPM